MTDQHFVRFPPHQRNILVPTGPRRASAQALAMYAPSKPRAVLALDALWLAARTFGVRVVPGAPEPWSPPMDPATFAELVEQWSRAGGRPADALAFYERIQPFRSALLVLVCAGENSLVVRLRTDPASLATERAISELAAATATTGPLPFRIPQYRGSGHAGGWHWVGYETMSQRPHAPERSADEAMTERITALVEQVIPRRPPDAPEHWRGAHGDLSPWNLRRARRHTWLIDWEDSGWAPPGADYVHHAAMMACLTSDPRGPLRLPDRFDEARRYWADRIAARVAVNPAERTLNARLRAALDG